MTDFFAFRKMITPTIIQIAFWIGVVATVISGIGMIVAGFVSFAQFNQENSQINGLMGNNGGLQMSPVSPAFPFFPSLTGGFLIVTGIVQMIVGPILVRVGCELVMLFFKIYDTLVEIRDRPATPGTSTATEAPHPG